MDCRLRGRAGLSAPPGPCALSRAALPPRAHAAPQSRAAAADLTRETILGAVPSTGEGETEGQPLRD